MANLEHTMEADCPACKAIGDGRQVLQRRLETEPDTLNQYRTLMRAAIGSIENNLRIWEIDGNIVRGTWKQLFGVDAPEMDEESWKRLVVTVAQILASSEVLSVLLFKQLGIEPTSGVEMVAGEGSYWA